MLFSAEKIYHRKRQTVPVPNTPVKWQNIGWYPPLATRRASRHGKLWTISQANRIHCRWITNFTFQIWRWVTSNPLIVTNSAVGRWALWISSSVYQTTWENWTPSSSRSLVKSPVTWGRYSRIRETNCRKIWWQITVRSVHNVKSEWWWNVSC